MDGVGGTIKNAVYRDAKSGKVTINSAKEFAEYVNKTITGISSLYMPITQVIKEPKDINEAPKIPKTLKIHIPCRVLNEGENPRFNFFYLGSDTDPFYSQIYRVKSECEHILKSPVDDNQCPQCRNKIWC